MSQQTVALVNAQLEFFNPGKAEQVLMGFPLLDLEGQTVELAPRQGMVVWYNASAAEEAACSGTTMPRSWSA